MPLKRENYVYQLSEVHLCDIGFKKGFKKYEYYKVAYYLPMFSCTPWHEAFKNYYFFRLFHYYKWDGILLYANLLDREIFISFENLLKFWGMNRYMGNSKTRIKFHISLLHALLRISSQKIHNTKGTNTYKLWHKFTNSVVQH